jgi:hypothetical protein
VARLGTDLQAAGLGRLLLDDQTLIGYLCCILPGLILHVWCVFNAAPPIIPTAAQIRGNDPSFDPEPWMAFLEPFAVFASISFFIYMLFSLAARI